MVVVFVNPKKTLTLFYVLLYIIFLLDNSLTMSLLPQQLRNHFKLFVHYVFPPCMSSYPNVYAAIPIVVLE